MDLVEVEEPVAKPDYSNVVGQDDLNRFDDKKGKNKKWKSARSKKKRRPQSSNPQNKNKNKPQHSQKNKSDHPRAKK